MRRRRNGWLLVALGAAVLIGPLRDHALAKRAKTRLVAMVNGKRLKGKTVVALYATTSFSINGATRPRRGLVRTVTANCGPVDIKAVALPTTLTGCFGSYTEAGRRAAAFKQWTGSGIDVTVETFDGTRITGTFRGTLATPTQAGAPPATIEGGSFSVALTNTGV